MYSLCPEHMIRLFVQRVKSSQLACHACTTLHILIQPHIHSTQYTAQSCHHTVNAHCSIVITGPCDADSSVRECLNQHL